MAGNYFYNFNKFVIESLSCNTSIQQTLVRLDISNNSMKIEDTPVCYLIIVLLLYSIFIYIYIYIYIQQVLKYV